MRKTLMCLTLLGALVTAPAALADTTLGTTTQPAGSSPGPCISGAVVAQDTDTPATPYLVPTGGGFVTSWQVNTAGATAGGALTFVIARPTPSDHGGDVLAVDSVSLPNPLPASGVASFTLPTPVQVTGGETFGLYAPAASSLTCFFNGTSVPAGNTLFGWTSPSAPTAGQHLTPATSPSPGGYEMNLAVTLAPPTIDAGVTTSIAPAGKTSVGVPAVLASVIANHAPVTSGITFSDTVPAGLSIKSVLAPPGTCTTSGQQVTCTFSGLTAGQQTSVAIVVSPSAAGTYTNQVTVSPNGVVDPVPSNNSASAVLTVTSPSVPHCTVPRLTGTPSGIAKRVLVLLGCKVGKVSTAHNKLAKGTVIGTKPGSGVYAVNRTIAITVSSGPKPKKKKKH